MAFVKHDHGLLGFSTWQTPRWLPKQNPNDPTTCLPPSFRRSTTRGSAWPSWVARKLSGAICSSWRNGSTRLYSASAVGAWSFFLFFSGWRGGGGGWKRLQQGSLFFYCFTLLLRQSPLNYGPRQRAAGEEPQHQAPKGSGSEILLLLKVILYVVSLGLS